ncbi:MAG: hypothetical protein HGA78_11400, partial [Nitrospirales bacterium]|nr:hypothetical protein [Nitrospirales bacterium]
MISLTDSSVRSSLLQRLWGISLAARNDTKREVEYNVRIWFGQSRDDAVAAVESWSCHNPSAEYQYDLIEIPPESINADLYVISVVWYKAFTFFGNNPFFTEAIYCVESAEPKARQFAAKYAQTRLQPGYQYSTTVWRISSEVLDA